MGKWHFTRENEIAAATLERLRNQCMADLSELSCSVISALNRGLITIQLDFHAEVAEKDGEIAERVMFDRMTC